MGIHPTGSTASSPTSTSTTSATELSEHFSTVLPTACLDAGVEFWRVSMLIDCDTCAVRDVSCGDCVMTVLLGPRSGSVELDSAEQRALGMLAGGGLLPPLRLVPATIKDPMRRGESQVPDLKAG